MPDRPPTVRSDPVDTIAGGTTTAADAYVIDLHSHVLPGLDDGAADLEASCAMLRAMVDDGVRVVVATPHVREDYPTTVAQMLAALDDVRAAASDEGLEIEILPGGEVAFDALTQLGPEGYAGFALGGRPHLLLVETPYHGWSPALEVIVSDLRSRGTTVLLAHPERNRAVQERPELLVPLARAGALFQLTAASVDGRLGRRAASTARALLDRGLGHVVASDAHTHEAGRVGLSGVARALGDRNLAQWLTAEMPAALLAGVTLAAPARRTRRPLSRALRRPFN